MKKTILGFVIPISIIFVIAGYFVYLKFQIPNSELSYYELSWTLFKDNWILVLIALAAYFYMDFIVPKIFKK